MPTYHYRCEKCKHEFEAVQKMMDPALTKCEACKGPVHRLISGGVSISFKGEGFHVNDYSGKGAPSKSVPSQPKAQPSASSESNSK